MFGQSRNYSMSKIKPAFNALLVLFFCLPVSATCVLVLITPEGIVVAADSKVLRVDLGEYSAPPEGPATKIHVIDNRIAVGDVGLGSVLLTTKDGRPLFSYDPASWFSGIEK